MSINRTTITLVYIVIWYTTYLLPRDNTKIAVKIKGSEINNSITTCTLLTVNLLINKITFYSLYIHFKYTSTIKLWFNIFYRIVAYRIYLSSSDELYIVFKGWFIVIEILVITCTLSVDNRLFDWTNLLLFLHSFWIFLNDQTKVQHLYVVIVYTVYW